MGSIHFYPPAFKNDRPCLHDTARGDHPLSLRANGLPEPVPLPNPVLTTDPAPNDLLGHKTSDQKRRTP